MRDDTETESVPEIETEAAPETNGASKKGKKAKKLTEDNADEPSCVKDLNGVTYDGNTETRWAFNPKDVFILGLDELIGEDDPLFDAEVETKLDDNMIKSVARDGVLEDISITPRVIDGTLVPCVVDGRHRTRWARAAKRPLIYAHNIDAEVDPRGAKHSANYVRATRTILGRAKAAKELSDGGRKNADIAIDLGCSVSSVENFLALAAAGKPLIDALNKGTIPITGAYKLAKLNPDKQAEAVKETLALAKESGTKAKVATASAGKRRAKGEKEASKRPGISAVRKILTALKDDEDIQKALSNVEPVDFLRWLVGDITDRVLPSEIRVLLKKRGKKSEE